jgi:hypothetical protein
VEVPLRPSEPELRELLDTAFFAGLHEEEGRTVTFDLIFVHREAAERAGFEALALEQPLALDARRLAKLALSASAPRTGIAVAPAAGGLSIWGLIHFGSRAAAKVAAQALSCLAVRVPSPGALSVEIGGDALFRYTRGRGSLPLERLDEGRRVAELIAPLVEVAALRGVARHVVAHGRGGAVLVLPEGDGPFAERFDELRYRVSGGAAGLLARPLSPERVEDAYAFVARLAAVDGAVLLTSALRVVAFGAFVKSPAESSTVPLVDALGRAQAASSLKGARHKAALWFCQSWPAALALVASQDGDVSLYVRCPGSAAVIVERDLEL